MADAKAFGVHLRAARFKAGFNTMPALVNHLADLDLEYDDSTIGHWENGRRVPRDRTLILPLLAALADRGGFNSLAEVNELLWFLDLRDLDDGEIQAHFSQLFYVSTSPNLPAQPFSKLIGREAIVTNLTQVLADPTAKSVVAISGLGGIGKTAIAYEVSRQLLLANHFEKLAWESAKSEEFVGVTVRRKMAQQINLPAILASFARQLGYEALTTLPADELSHRLRDILRAGNYLLVLDNLETAGVALDVAKALHELVSPPRHPQPSKILITSRNRLNELSFVHDEFIRGLSEKDSLELIQLEADRAKDTLLTANPNRNKRIYEVTGGMPLAIKLIVSQYLLGIELDDELTRLEKAADEEELYRFIYFDLWSKLSIPAQKVLAGIAAFGTSARRSMLVNVSKVEELLFNQTIPELVRVSLVEIIRLLNTETRYDIHPMTRWFVNGPLIDLWNAQKGS